MLKRVRAIGSAITYLACNKLTGVVVAVFSDCAQAKPWVGGAGGLQRRSLAPRSPAAPLHMVWPGLSLPENPFGIQRCG